MKIAASVLDDWGAWTAQFEGRVSTLYLDVKGLATVGLGCLLPNVAASQALDWLRPDGAPASLDEIAADWRRVGAMPAGLYFSRYAANPNALHLDDYAIDWLARQRLQADADQLAMYFPDFATFPPEAERALLSLAWACGAGFPPSWPLLSDATRKRNWRCAAANCALPGYVARSKAQVALFLAAADADPGPSDPTSRDEATT